MRRLNIKKKGQIGDAVTWIVATVVIVVIMIFFIFGASLLAETKTIKFKDSLFSSEGDAGDDIFMKKSIFSYIKTTKDHLKKKILRDMDLRAAKKEFKIPYNETKTEIMSRSKLE